MKHIFDDVQPLLEYLASLPLAVRDVGKIVERIAADPRRRAVVRCKSEPVRAVCIAHFPLQRKWAAFEVRYPVRRRVSYSERFTPWLDYADALDAVALVCTETLLRHNFALPPRPLCRVIVERNFAYALDWGRGAYVCSRVGVLQANPDAVEDDLEEPERLAYALGIPLELAARIVHGSPEEVEEELTMLALSATIASNMSDI